MSDPTLLAPRFAALGLGEKPLQEALKNKKVSTTWDEILTEAGIEATTTGVDPKAASAFSALVTATKDAGSLDGKRAYVAKAIKDGKIKSNVQVDAAVKYIKACKGDIDDAAFDKECGVGIEFTSEAIAVAVAEYMEAHKGMILEQRYKAMTPVLVNLKTQTALKWAPPAEVKKEMDIQLANLLGPKDERDAPPKKQPKAAPEAKGKKPEVKKDEEISKDRMFEEGFLAALHKPGGNEQIIPANMEAHLKATGRKVFTRFPPEPNGYLHIGHSKAIAVNFGFARYHGGECYLRYDDTNPTAEEEKYFTAILDIVEWLGFKPYKITYASDNFDKLYELAEDLIKRGYGYICHCTGEEVNAQRGGKDRGPRSECIHRNRPIEESLDLFRQMRDGKFKPQEAQLRMKQDILGSGNPQMWDLTAYRVLDAEHHRTGDKWKIYPTYDFTHCLCDSFENISHSLCTTEFINSRESYDWLCNVLEIYRPQQREYGRLNLTGTIMSKRKIARLVNEGYVRGWDDPRLYTLVAIRRRGVPPGAILSFVNELGVTTAHSFVQIKRFEQTVRRYLEDTVPRLMMITDPVRVVLENLPHDHLEEISLPFKPSDESLGNHAVPFTRILYIDRSDFRETDSSDYFRLAPGKSVGLLKVPHTIRATALSKNASGEIIEIICHYENDIPFKKPKTYIQWVADCPSKGSPVPLEVRVTNQLFKSETPESNPGGFLADINPDSEQVFPNAIIEVGIHEVQRRAPWPELEGEKNQKHVGPETVRFQALRVGYFALDSDSKEGALVVNRIVTLKEDAGKSA
ncbi:tRNA synthetases class I, catalytic domain-containing protein [Morchella snyderi]|nr:tRNA synthetases class I, catalytic domain-containing protein [Morchella snyderi]